MVQSFSIFKKNLDNQKIEILNLTENFELKKYTLIFKDNKNKPVINAKVYMNNFEVGITNSEGKLQVNYHKNKKVYVKIEDRCYYFSNLIEFKANKAKILLIAKNLCD